MMLKSIKQLVFSCAGILVLLLPACKEEKKPFWSRHPSGFYYRLHAFRTDSNIYRQGHYALVTASFKTQSDSVFWDSFNNLNDRLFIKIDSSSADILHRYVSTSAEGDSASILMGPSDFFYGRFKNDNIPFFSSMDSVIRIDFRIKKIMNPEEFRKLERDLLKDERYRIATYFKTDKNLELARDPLGFFWLERPQPSVESAIEEGDFVKIAYEGAFLNGRFLEKSDQDFEFIYGTPDQLLKGLNYVIGKLKKDQTAKILLSSRLAFGESGSSNGMVPPYTPLTYKIKIIDVKKIK